MLRVKKTACAVLMVGSTAAFAGTMGPVCAPGAVTVPCEQQAWDFGIQALYLKPATNNHMAYYSVDRDDFNQDWGWGFKLEGSYHFNTGNDLNLNWTHFSHTTNYNVRGLEMGDWGLGITEGFTGITSALAGKAQWDAVNLEFGQHVDFGDYKNIRFHGGVQYARLEENLSTTTDNYPGDITQKNMRFNGFGPRTGLDMSYDVGNGLAIYGNAASALLIGTSKIDLIENTGTTARTGSLTTIVPELEGKLGATYTYAMAQGDLTLDAGYLWVNYFNVLNDTSIHSDMSFNGPYVGMKWVGNM